jgi:hypothetical protein
MNNIKRKRGLVFSVLFIWTGLFLSGCNATTNTTTGGNNSETNSAATNTEETNSNSPSDKTEENKETASLNEIEVKEPETYEGTISLKVFGLGEKESVELPTSLEAKFAKNLTNKRMEFNLPNQQKLIYLEKGKENLIVLPTQKQYAELNEKSTGFQVRSLMSPEQMISQVKNLKGVEKVGEEKVDGRDAVKYKYANETQTNTKAGEVKTESFILVDKVTGLPLRTELVSTSDQKVQGYNGIKIVTEMKGIKTEVSDDIFNVPEGFEKVEEEKIRQQIGIIFKAATLFLEQFVKSMSSN